MTETRYFEAFPVSADVQVAVRGEGKNTKSLVRTAREHAKAAAKAGAAYDEVWVVYDKDDFTDEQFNTAEEMVRSASAAGPGRWHAAWSNPAFELWYLLHFVLVESDLDRRLVSEKLQDQLRANKICERYRKNHPDMYTLLLAFQEKASQRAQRLERASGIAPGGSTTPASARPCTTVHRLVAALNAEIPR